MKTYRSMGELPLGGARRVVAIGTFDGVHLGHQAILGRALELAHARGLAAMAITFEPHPIAVLRPELRTTVLTTAALKAQLIERLGLDELLFLPFSRAFARIRADRFVDMIGSPPISAEAAVVGDNFRFGYQGAGTALGMAQYGRARGLQVSSPDTVASPDGKPISSTRIRRLIADGRIDEVVALLGRPHVLEGVVVHGEQRGRAMGLPTANLELSAETAIPGRGVYAGRAIVAGRRYPAAVNVGFAPTFRETSDRGPVRIEAFLIDYEGPDIYDTTLRLEFLARLRDERRFDSPTELVVQIRADVERTRGIAQNGPQGAPG
jgi:riboflavin kinase / FMN adenylyltransferase